MFNHIILRCPVCGTALAAWYQDGVKKVKCPFCLNEISVRPNQEAVKEEATKKADSPVFI